MLRFHGITNCVSENGWSTHLGWSIHLGWSSLFFFHRNWHISRYVNIHPLWQWIPINWDGRTIPSMELDHATNIGMEMTGHYSLLQCQPVPFTFREDSEISRNCRRMCKWEQIDRNRRCVPLTRADSVAAVSIFCCCRSSFKGLAWRKGTKTPDSTLNMMKRQVQCDTWGPGPN